MSEVLGNYQIWRAASSLCWYDCLEPTQ